MLVKFTKMHGAGNDFILFYDLPIELNPDQIKRICNRHFGIGADGVLIIEKSKKFDFSLKYFNSDGSGEVLCINGARCAVWFAYKNKLCDEKVRFEFIDKVFSAEICDENLINIYIDYQPEIELNKTLELNSSVINYNFVDIGSKHIIIDFSLLNPNLYEYQLYHEFEKFDVNRIGKQIRNLPIFSPNGINVNFVLKKSENDFYIRTYERGVENETLACGSGSISTALILYLTKAIIPPINLLTRSGYTLQVNFDGEKNNFRNISLRGPAEVTFEGTIEL